jgi:hypothetical protein
MIFVLKNELVGPPNLEDHVKYTTIVSGVCIEPTNIATFLTMDKHISNHYQKRSPIGSTPEPSPRTKLLKICSNQHAKGCALVYLPHLIFKNAFLAKDGGKRRAIVLYNPEQISR